MKLQLAMVISALFLLISGLAYSTEKQEDPAESKVRQIAKELRCAVCQNQSIYESNSDLAKDMLGIIRQKVAAGEEIEKIRDYFFQRYGDYIYLEPTKHGLNWILWAGPFFGLVIGGWALFAAFGQWTRRSVETQEAIQQTGQVNPEVLQKIKDELSKVDV